MKMMKLMLLISILCVQQLVAQTGTAYAFIVGVSNYQEPQLTKLNFPDRDAQRFKEFLTRRFIQAKVDTNNIKTYINDEAKVDDIYAGLLYNLIKLKGKVKPGDEIYIYWSGHGITGKSDQQFICSDTKALEGLTILSDYISMNDIKSAIRRFADAEGVRVFLIVDTCQSTVIEGESVTSEVQNVVHGIAGKNEMYFYACDVNKVSYESEKLNPGSGVFTYFLILGLLGAADNKPADRKVTMLELNDFVSNAVSNYVEKVFTVRPDDQKSQKPISKIENTLNPAGIVLTFNIPKKTVDSAKLVYRGIKASIDSINPLPSPPAGERYRIAKDTPSSNMLYASFSAAIRNAALITPRGYSAYDFYKQMEADKEDSARTEIAKNHLFKALLNKVKVFIEQYLLGRLTEIRKDAYDRAYEELETCLSLAPDMEIFGRMLEPQLIFLKACALAESHKPGDWDEGLRLINDAMKDTAKHAYLYHTKGILFANKSRYFSAIRLYDSARLSAPKWTYLLYNLASTYYRIEEYEKSISYCDSVIKYNPLYSRAYSLMGQNFETITDMSNPKNYDHAISFNTKALTLDSFNTAAYFNLGSIYSKIPGYRRVAFDNYKKGADLDNEDCMVRLAKLYFDMGFSWYDSAAYQFRRALTTNPYNVNTLNYCATLLDSASADSLLHTTLKQSGFDYKIYNVYRSFLFNYSPEDADSVYREIIRINSEDPSVYIDHANQYELIDSVIKARSILLNGMAHVPRSPSLNHAMAKLYYNNLSDSLLQPSPLDSAEHYLTILRELTPQYSLAKFNLWQVSARKNQAVANNYRDSAVLMNRFVNITQNFNKDLVTHGDTSIRRKKYNDALEYYKAAIPLADDKHSILLKIARVHYLSNKLNVARDMCIKLLDTATELSTINSAKIRELLGLIAIERKANRFYREALEIFKEIDEEKDSPELLQQAVCYYLLRDSYSTNSATSAPNKNAVYRRMIAAEGTEYSPYFIMRLKDVFLTNLKTTSVPDRMDSKIKL